MNLFWFLLIGLAAGWLAGAVTRGSGFGILGDILVGVVGSILGGLLFTALGITGYGLLGALIMATVGAIALIVLLRVACRTARPAS
jgi:uncharacterized membrane protein YeaQ/YmgE (transglycosylase-associated protein family)